MKIVFLDAKTLGADFDLTLLDQFGELTTYPVTSEIEVIERSLDADILVLNKVKITREVLSQLPHLKLICIAATGMDNVDLDAAKDYHVEVKNVSGYSTASVVQHTFAMAMHLSNNLNYYNNYTSSKEWIQSDTFSHFLDFPDIAGKNWGIIGLGTIGKSVAGVAKAFGANVSYYSTSGKNSNNDFYQQSLSELLSTSDFISIHAPLNEKTKDLLAKNELSMIKSGAILLNLGRGGIINEHDLVPFIQNKNFYVALDVLSSEPMPADNPLVAVLDSKNLLITPHIAWASVDSRKKLLEGIALNIRNFLDAKMR